jgi:hypothetical protein
MASLKELGGKGKREKGKRKEKRERKGIGNTIGAGQVHQLCLSASPGCQYSRQVL